MMISEAFDDDDDKEIRTHLLHRIGLLLGLGI
jgi:hypothetical protein